MKQLLRGLSQILIIIPLKLYQYRGIVDFIGELVSKYNENKVFIKKVQTNGLSGRNVLTKLR